MVDTHGLSGGQIDWILSHLLKKAIDPLAKASQFVRRLAGEIICQPFTDGRRRVSAVPKKKANCHLFAAMCSRNPTVQVTHLMSAQVERNLIHSALVNISNYADRYCTEVINSAKSVDISLFVESVNRKIGGKSSDLFFAISEASYWVAEYEKLRNTIIMQFENLARSTTDSIVRGTVLAIDWDDMYKNMMLGVQRAIDKYSSDKGTLISYVRMWMRDAHTNPQFQHEYGNSFSVSAGERRRITNTINAGDYAISNLSVEMDEASTSADDLTPEKLLEDDNFGIKVSHILAKLPKAQYAFLNMEIPYYLNAEQKALLASTLKNN